MDFRRETENNPEDNCNYFNRMKLRRHAKETDVPVAKFDAVHVGISSEEGKNLSESLFRGLPGTMEVALGAVVILIHNLAVEHGLLNGTQGTIKDIIFDTRVGPNHDDARLAMPRVIVVDFPNYVGPAFFDERYHPDKRHWVPLEPREVAKDDNRSIRRLQFPLVLGWALTPWKAQGMTLATAVVRMGRKAAAPGVLFVALTRVRHPDDLMLDDEFPDMLTIMQQKKSPNFAKRLRWEGQMRARFSKTIRYNMQDDNLYSKDKIWTPDLCNAAEEILAVVKRGKYYDVTPATWQQMAASHVNLQTALHQKAWEKLQTWPHDQELLFAAQGLSGFTKSMKGDLSMSRTFVDTWKAGDWNMKPADWFDFAEHGVIAMPIMHYLINIVKTVTTSSNAFASPYAMPKWLNTEEATRMLLNAQNVTGKSCNWSVYPYRTKSKRWTLFFLGETSVGHCAKRRLKVVAPENLCSDAYAYAVKCFEKDFGVISEIVKVHWSKAEDCMFLPMGCVCPEIFQSPNWKNLPWKKCMVSLFKFAAILMREMTANGKADLCKVICESDETRATLSDVNLSFLALIQQSARKARNSNSGSTRMHALEETALPPPAVPPQKSLPKDSRAESKCGILYDRSFVPLAKQNLGSIDNKNVCAKESSIPWKPCNIADK